MSNIIKILASIIGIIVMLVGLYHIVKYAIMAIVRSRGFNENDIKNEAETYKQIEDIAKILYGSHGMGTEIFDGLTKEQKKSFQPDFKEITSSYREIVKRYYSDFSKKKLNREKLNEDFSVLNEKIRKMQEKVNTLKVNM